MRRLLLAALVVGLPLLSACGDDDDTAVAPEEFQREVNTLCEEEHARVDAMFEDFPEEPTPEDMQQLIGEFASTFETYRDGLVAAGPPEGQQAEYDDYVDVVNSHLADLKRGADDAAEAERLFNQEGEDPLNPLEQELGLDVCASR